MKQAGCPYCGQVVMVEAPEGTPDNLLSEMAMEACGCEGAGMARRRKRRRQKAEDYVRREFGGQAENTGLMLSAVEAVSEYAASGVTITVGKAVYTVSMSEKKGLFVKKVTKDASEVVFGE